MTQTLRQIFEKFLKEFKESYNRKILEIINDLHIAISKLYNKSDLYWQGYEKALKDMKKAIGMVK